MQADEWQIDKLGFIVYLKLLTVTHCRTQQEFDQFIDNQNQQNYAHNLQTISSLPQSAIQSFSTFGLMHFSTEEVQEMVQEYHQMILQQAQNGSLNANIQVEHEYAQDNLEDGQDQDIEINDFSNSLSETESD